MLFKCIKIYLSFIWREEITRKWTVPTVKFNTSINDVKCKTTGSGKVDTVGQCVCVSPNSTRNWNRYEVKPVQGRDPIDKLVWAIGTQLMK